MDANVYHTDGSVEKKVTLPEVFGMEYREDIVRRALLAEQSSAYQPQGHYVFAGMNTSAKYVGRYGTYRTLRHTGLPARPRQVLAKGAMGQVRRIPYAVKGRRAHPHMVGKRILERINRKEYEKAIEIAVAGTGNAALIKQYHVYSKESLPIVMSNDIEKVSKAKELMKVLKTIGLSGDVEKSHKPRLDGNERTGSRRRFRNSVLFVVKDVSSIGKAGRNIPGVDVLSVESLRIEVLAPGAKPRLTVWSEAAITALKEGIEKSVVSYKQ